ncbi:MAG: hypothetical protein IPJ65_32160 [Archangiaceae bacterium]|nr:hypothetical protein [Archangiaceae bacterium]
MKRAFIVFAVAASLAWAQAPANGAAPVSNAAPAADERDNPPNPEKIRRSAEALQQMRQALKDVLTKLEEARNSRDVVKLNCVNEKLTQVKGLLRISELADVAMQEAIAKKEDSGALHEYTKVSIASTKVTQLRAEAEQCLGQLAFRTDENLAIDVEVPEDLPKGDPTAPDTPIRVDARPAPASSSL